MSAKNHLNERDVQSIIRHTLYPALATAIMAGVTYALEVLEAELMGSLTTQAAVSTGIVGAVLSGGLRLWKRFRMSSSSEGG